MGQSFSDISLYHEYRSVKEKEHLVSQKTWDDLNLDDFFEWADRTSSCVGRQYLYDLLHYNRLSEISEQEEVIRELSADKELRAEIRSELQKLDTPDACAIASLFSISHPIYSRRFYRLLSILQFVPFVLSGMVYVTSSLYVLGLLCISVLVNMVLHYRSKARIQGYFFSIPQLWLLLRQAERLAQIPLCVSVHRDIQKTLQALRPLRKQLSTFRFSIKLESDIAIAEIPVKYSSDTDTLQLYPNDSMMTLLPSTSDGTVTQKYFHLPDYVCAPIQQGDVVGTVELKLAGETIGVVELIAGQDVARNPLLFGVDKVKEFFTSLYLKVVLVLSLIAALIYGLWLLCANWNRRKPTKKIHRRY